MQVEKLVCPFCRKSVRVIRPSVDANFPPWLSAHNRIRGLRCPGSCASLPFLPLMIAARKLLHSTN